MSELAPCPSCHRHIRLTSAACPFCDAPIAPSVLSQARAARRAPIQKGVKRAVLFAIGAGLTSAACADGEEPGVDTTDDSATSTATTSSTASTSSAATATTTDDSETTELAQPVYGAPVDTTDTTTTIDDDSSQVFLPVYGAPVAPVTDTSAGADAGVGDAGAGDASVPDASADGGQWNVTKEPGPTWNDDGGGLAVPLYGAIPAEVE
jgi:hypothetical protein